MPVKITDRFASQCSVVYNTSYDTCGTVTRSTIAHLTPTQLESLFSVGGLFADLDAWFKYAIEMKACGTITNGLYDWLMANSDTGGRQLLNKMNVGASPSLLFPFILGKQDSVINTDYWAIRTGAANSGYTPDSPATAIGTGTAGPLTTAQVALGAASDRVVRVISRYGVEMNSQWFVDRDVVHIFTRGNNGVQQNGAWKVLASAASTDKTYVDVLVTSQNAGSSAPYATAPTTGVLLPGVPNVNDYEKWCNNRPNFDGRKRVPFWFQTYRWTRCVDSEYRKVYARLNETGVNRAWQEFGDLPFAERNRQDEAERQKRFCNAFFYNKPISANQTLANWQSLDDITTPSGFSIDPGTGGKVIAKRANFIGLVEQLRACDRVRDGQNHLLNLYEFFAENYRIMRARKSQGRKVTDIDWYTDSVTRANFMTGMLQYYKNEYLDQLRITMEPGGSNDLGMVWDSYRVKHPAGVRINIISHDFFDDLRDAHKTEGQESMGINFWCLDIGKPGPNGGTIYWSQIATNMRRSTVGELKDLSSLDKDWACVMESISQEITMMSETGTVVCECPNNSIMLMNYADGVPVTTGISAS